MKTGAVARISIKLFKRNLNWFNKYSNSKSRPFRGGFIKMESMRQYWLESWYQPDYLFHYRFSKERKFYDQTDVLQYSDDKKRTRD